MLTISSLIFDGINYKFSLNNIYIASYLHVKKNHDFFKNLNFDKHKIKKFECFLDASNSTLLPYYYKKFKDEIIVL